MCIFFLSGEASLLRVGYQKGLPRLVVASEWNLLKEPISKHYSDNEVTPIFQF